MTRRYFSHQPIAAGEVTLAGDEARHLSQVMRAKVGEHVTLFDGSGAEFDAEIVAIERRSAELRVIERREIDREAAARLTLAVALPKGDRQKWLVEKATELGVHRIVPLITDRGVAQPTAGAIERLRRGVIEASKQCGRNRLMEIGAGQTLAEVVEESRSASVRWIAHPCGRAEGEARLAAGDLTGAPEVVVLVGPEGGFTDEEVDFSTAADCTRLDLGPTILRTETAAVAVAAKLLLGEHG